MTPADAACPDREACQTVLARSLRRAHACDFPYPYWLLADVLPAELVWALSELPIAAPLGPVLGQPSPHAARRRLVTEREIRAFAACRAAAETFRSDETLALIAGAAGVSLSDCRARISLAREVDGYMSAPHTRHGQVRFTLMLALDAGGQRNLGPDIYFETGAWATQAPWGPGAALAFAPSERTWHGFEPRMIRGVRSSLIVDYVPAALAQAVHRAPAPRSAGRGG